MSGIERANLPATRPAPPPAIRDNPLMALRQAIMVLDDQRAALAEAGDYEGLAFGGRDLGVLVGELDTVLRQVRVDVAELLDDVERERRTEIRERALDDGKKVPKFAEEDARLGKVKREVDGLRLVEVNGGYDRKGWQSLDLLRKMLGIALDDMALWTSEGEDAHAAVYDRLVEVLGDTMPLHPSLQWKVGTDWEGKPPTGLRKYGINPDEWCDRTDKLRLASWPRGME